MGALHDGHAALFRAARAGLRARRRQPLREPGQFSDPADLAAYPRQEARDAELAAGGRRRCDVRPAGGRDVSGPARRRRWTCAGAAIGFEGTFRPGHFDSVATVCLKLFNIVEPEVAFFGQKDAQQVAVVRQMVRDLQLNLQIEVVPTVREADGLALSSRNVRLSADERRRALAIPRALAAGLAAPREDPARRRPRRARRPGCRLRGGRGLRRGADARHRGARRAHAPHRQRSAESSRARGVGIDGM